MLTNGENIVTQMGDPNAAELLILRLGLFRERCDKRAAGNACSISYGPALIFEAINESLEQCRNMLPEWLLPLIIDRDFIADLADTVTSCLSHSMVVGLRLRDVIGCNWVSVSAHDLLPCLSKHLPPRLDAVVADTLSHIVPVKTHPWH